MRQDLEEVLLSDEQIQRRLDELATEIQRDHVDKDLTLVAILTGSVRFCTLLGKDVPHRGNSHADYVAFHIPNRFVVGYGLDYQERYRNLPCVGTLRTEAIAAKL